MKNLSSNLPALKAARVLDQLRKLAASRDVILRTLEWVKASLDPKFQAGIRANMQEAEASGAVQTGDFGKAVTIYATLVERHPDSGRLHLAFGEALLGARRYTDASPQFTRAKELKGGGPRDIGLPAARAAALAGEGDSAIGWLKSIPPQFLPAAVKDDAGFQSIRTRPDFQALFVK